MILILSKVIPAFIYPAGLVVVLCLVATWLAARRGAWAVAAVTFVAALILYAGASPWVANRYMVKLEGQNPPLAEYPKAAAIVLLGGSTLPMTPPRLYPETGAAGDRVIHAARLWRLKRAPVMVVTGGYIPFLVSTHGSEADVYANFLTEMFDVPDSSIRRVGGSKTTQDDATMSASLFDSLGMKKEILLVTSASHMPRAVALFRKNGFTVIPASTDFNATANDPFLWIHLLPSAEALQQTSIVIREHIGMWAYKMLGRI